MDAEQTVQGKDDDREVEGGTTPAEVDLTRVETARHAAMEALGIMTENLRTYLQWRRRRTSATAE
jgi:hypothetical protein